MESRLREITIGKRLSVNQIEGEDTAALDVREMAQQQM